MEAKIQLKNNIDEIPLLAQKIEDIGEKWELTMALILNINLVLEEAVSNIIFYAYPDQETHHIDILLELETNQLCVKISDDGIPFDPTKKEDPNILLPIEEREIGGLGIFLIKEIMDEVIYRRENNQNILTLKKSI